MSKRKKIKLFYDTYRGYGRPKPIDQPLDRFGFHWKRPTDGMESGYWTNREGKKVETAEVATSVRLDILHLTQWECPVDNEAYSKMPKGTIRF